MEVYVQFAMTWWAVFLVFSGVGLWLYRAFRLEIKRAETWFLAFWAGWALLLTFLQIWHFFFPVNDASRIIFGLVGIAGILFSIRPLARLMVRGFAWRLPFYIFAIALTIWIGNRSLQTPTWMWDMGMYHMDAVKWASAYPTIPGLGNLHSRLGFSSTFFLFPAWLNTGPWEGITWHVGNSQLFLILTLQMAASLIIMLRKRLIEIQHLFNVLMGVVIWWFMLMDSTIPNISNDPPVFAIGVVTASQLLALIHSKELSPREAAFRLVLIVLLASVGIAIKFSFGLVGVFTSFIALFVWLRRFGFPTIQLPSQELSFRQRIRPYVIQAAKMIALLGFVSLLVLIPMMARSVWMTGYPAYPSIVGPFAVEWRIYPEHAELETRFIQAFARKQNAPIDEVLADDSWFDGWIDRYVYPSLASQYVLFAGPVFLACGAAIVLAVFRATPFVRRVTRPIDIADWLFIFALIGSLFFWFDTAPDPRFAGATFWVLAVVLVVLLFKVLRLQQLRALTVALPVLVAVLVFAPFDLSESREIWIEPHPQNTLYPLEEALAEQQVEDTLKWLKSERPDDWQAVADFWIAEAVKELYPITQYTTRTGLRLYTPEESNQCWDAPLPCTPYPHPALELRNPDDISDGFILRLAFGDRPQRIN